MFNRRSLIKCAAGLFASIPFIGMSKKSEASTEFKANFGQDGGIIDLGKMLSTKIENNYCLEHYFEIGTLHKYLQFPTESILTIEYERGTEVWQAYNVPYGALTQFNFARVFKTRKYEIDYIDKVSGKIHGALMNIDGSKYRLSYISVKDTNDELVA